MVGQAEYSPLRFFPVHLPPVSLSSLPYVSSFVFSFSLHSLAYHDLQAKMVRIRGCSGHWELEDLNGISQEPRKFPPFRIPPINDPHHNNVHLDHSIQGRCQIRRCDRCCSERNAIQCSSSYSHRKISYARRQFRKRQDPRLQERVQELGWLSA